VLDSVIEVVKFVGGLSGLASIAFIVYDRVIRSRPSAFLVPADYKTNLRFSNVAAETIIVDEIKVDPPIIKVANANDLVTGSAEKLATMYPRKRQGETERIFILIKSMEERTFPLHRFVEFESATGSTPISIRCRWKNTRRPFPFNRYVTVRTTVREVADIREASLANKV
jgi:hypothetical protein